MNVNVFDENGQFVNIPEEQVQEALTQGYKIATQEDVRKQVIKEKYGEGFQNELVTGIEGALSGATFGLSRHASNYLNLTTPESQAARKELSPVASGVGEVGGILGSMVVAPGASLPGLLSRGTTKAGASIAGRILEEGVARQIAGKVVGGALEGMAYGASQPISESALGDPTLTAQKAITQIGIGGLLGGAIGGATSALGIGGKKLFSKSVSPQAEALVAKSDDFGSKPAFDLPDEKILKRAERLNPTNPLKQHDLDAVRRNGVDSFEKLGTDEIPTFAERQKAVGKVTGEDAFRMDLSKADDLLESQENQAQELISNSGLTMTIDDFKNIFKKVQDDLYDSFDVGEGREAAIKQMNKYITQVSKEAQRTGKVELSAQDIRKNLQSLWKDNKRFYKPGVKEISAEEIAISDATKEMNSFLKTKIPGYGDLMDSYAPNVRTVKELQKQLKLENGEPMISNWFDNRVANPLEDVYIGKATSKHAKTLHEFSKMVGRDWQKITEVNKVYGKLFPELAEGAQRTKWTETVRSALGAIRRPLDTATDIGESVLSGEGIPLLRDIQARGVRDLLTGKSTNPQAVDSILSKFGEMGEKGSAFLDGPLSHYLTPASVKQWSFVQASASVDEADQKLETLMALEKAQKKADQHINTAVKGIFSDKAYPLETARDAYLTQKPQELAKSFQDLQSQFNELANNPEMLIDRLEQSTQGIDAPDVVAALNMTAIRSMQLLNQKLNQINPGEKLPLDENFVPSSSDLYSLTKTMKYINQPWDVLKEVATGRLSKEGLEVLQTVYPELYAQMQSLVLSGISEEQAKGRRIPMSKKLSMSAFLGQPLDSTMKPESIMSNQAVFAMPQATQNQPNPRASSSKHLGLSGRAQTNLQKIASKSD